MVFSIYVFRIISLNKKKKGFQNWKIPYIIYIQTLTREERGGVGGTLSLKPPTWKNFTPKSKGKTKIEWFASSLPNPIKSDKNC